MSKRVRESGHTYCMKKAKRDREAAALSGSMDKFLTVQPKPSSSTTEEKSESIESNDESESSGSDAESAKRSETQREDGVQSDSEKQIEPLEFDPHTWPNVLPDSFRELIVKTGVPPIPKPRTNYPQHKGCSFNDKIFYAAHANGTIYERDWLLYSESSDSVYCLFCANFNRNIN